MGRPTTKTLKRLFALSSNRCAFPDCKATLVDLGSGKVTGRVCHIAAASANGPRHDATQTEVQRHAFENLMLLCGAHHDVVDDDSAEYTVERLVAMKRSHEERASSLTEADIDSGASLLATIQTGDVAGSVITTVNQSGGQVAHSIVNLGPTSRVLAEAHRQAIVRALAPAKGRRILFASTLGDSESFGFSDQLERCARVAQLDVHPSQASMWAGPVSGVQIQYDAMDATTERAAREFCRVLVEHGFLARVDAGSNRNAILVVVGDKNTNVSW